MLKKILLTAVLAGAGYLLISNSAPVTPPITSGASTDTATLVIDSGTPATYSATLSGSATALSLLTQITSRENISLEIKTYDFGTLVQSINNLSNSPQAAWIYFINGQSATQAADLHPIRPGDRIEWRYTKPI